MDQNPLPEQMPANKIHPDIWALRIMDSNKWYAGMSSLLVVASGSLFEKLPDTFRLKLFIAIVLEVLSMIIAGIVYIYNAHYLDAMDRNLPQAFINKMHDSFTLIGGIQVALCIVGYLMALFALYGLVIK